MNKRETVLLSNQNIGGSFGSKMTFTVGSAYLGFAGMGILTGLINIRKPKFRLPTQRLVVSYYFKHMTTNSIQYANKGAAAALLYSVCGFTITKLFEESLMNLDQMKKNALIGFSTGLIYKSTRGPVAALVGGSVALAMVVSLNLTTNWLRERDYIKFEMRFD